MKERIFIRPALVTTLILAIPLCGVLFGGWSWGWGAFVFFGAILFPAGVAYEYAGKYAKRGVIGGFFFGALVATGIIAMLRYMNPNDDVAGVVIITYLICGLFFAVLGFLIQKYFVAQQSR